MPAKPLEIGLFTFAKKGDATEYYRAILYRYDLGVVIPEPDVSHLFWLLERHPEAATKIGAGVKHFTVRSALYNTRCFEIQRVDGTSTDFSLKSCLDGKAPSALAELLRALRAEAAEEEIKQKKWELFRTSTHTEGKVRCALSGRDIAVEEAIVDHAPPNTFKALGERFLAERKITATIDLVTPSRDNQYVPLLTDRELASAWLDFYRKYATVRVIAR